MRPALLAPALFALGLGMAAPVFAQQAVVDVGVGHPLRKPILDGLRPAIEADLGQRVVFVVSDLRVQGDRAFFAGRPQRPDGRAIDFSRTRYAEALEQGVFDGPGTYALLRRIGGRWTVETFVIGPTDVAWSGWPEEFGVSWELVNLPRPQ
jgi:hypothetical protein